MVSSGLRGNAFIMNVSLFIFVFYQPEFDGRFRVQVDVPLRKSDDDICITKYFVDLKSDAAFDEATFDDSGDADPEVDLKNQGVIPEIFKDNKWIGRLEDLIIPLDRLKEKFFHLLYR